MHAQNFARAITLIEKGHDGAAYVVKLQLTSGLELIGALSELDGFLIWLHPEPVGPDDYQPPSVLVDVTYVECITPVYLP